MRKKYRVTYLFHKSNLWFEKRLRNFNFKLNNKYTFKISKNKNKVQNQDIVFPLSYPRILPDSFLKKNKLVLIIHGSKLPKDKGFSPIQYQILKNKKKIYISLIRATSNVDSGPIYLQKSFKFNGTELYDEIRHIQGKMFLSMIKDFLLKYPNINSKKQIGKSNFNKKRSSKDNELIINKTIKQQFNNLRISDNEKFPSYFYYKDQKYIIKIYKEKK